MAVKTTATPMAATGVIATVAVYQQQGQVCFFYLLFIYSTNKYSHIDHYMYEQQLTVTYLFRQ